MGTGREMMIKIGKRIAEIRGLDQEMPDEYYETLAEDTRQRGPELYQSVRREMIDIIAPIYCGKGEEGREVLAEIDRGAKIAGKSRTQYVLDLVRADLAGGGSSTSIPLRWKDGLHGSSLFVGNLSADVGLVEATGDYDNFACYVTVVLPGLNTKPFRCDSLEQAKTFAENIVRNWFVSAFSQGE